MSGYESIFRPGLFEGQAILITGGGTGLGRCTAHELASLGAQVAIVGLGAIGSLVGAYLTLWALFWGSLVGAVIAVWVLLGQGKLMRGVGRSLMAALRLGRSSPPAKDSAPQPAGDDSEAGEPETPPEQQRIPYGVALAFGTMVAWFLHAPSTGW